MKTNNSPSYPYASYHPQSTKVTPIIYNKMQSTQSTQTDENPEYVTFRYQKSHLSIYQKPTAQLSTLQLIAHQDEPTEFSIQFGDMDKTELIYALGFLIRDNKKELFITTDQFDVQINERIYRVIVHASINIKSIMQNSSPNYSARFIKVDTPQIVRNKINKRYLKTEEVVMVKLEFVHPKLSDYRGLYTKLSELIDNLEEATYITAYCQAKKIQEIKRKFMILQE